MSNAVHTTIDRREIYYTSAASHIAADPLDFYCRAERGRRLQAEFRQDYAREQMRDAEPVSPDYHF